MRRISSASIPVSGATASGVNGCGQLARARSAPLACSASAPGSARSSAISTLAIANSRWASVPGRMKWCSDASLAVRLRRGSIDHDLAAALADRAQASAHVGRGQQRAVRDQRVGAEDQQVVGAVDVGDRDAEPGAEHQPGRDLLRHLVDGRRRVDVLRPQRLQERGAVEHRPEAVGARGCRCRRRPRRARPLEHAAEPLGHRGERLLPARLDQLAVAAHERLVSRSGSSWSCLRPCDFGQRKPWLKTSSSSPRTETTSSPRIVTSRPQVASQNGQVR